MTGINRRGFLTGSIISSAVSGQSPGASANAPSRGGIIDTHVYVSGWPARRIPGDGTPDLVTMLRTKRVTQAWAGSFDALLHKDVSVVNARLAAECKLYGPNYLLPFGAINPMLPDWEEDLRRCHEEFKMPGVRLHPNYHNYTLQDPSFVRVMQLAAERGLLVQIVIWMEDERCQVPLLRVPPVDVSPLPAILERIPGVKAQVLNAFSSIGRAQEPIPQFRSSTRVAFDFARLDGLMDLRNLTAAVGLERVVFGSHSPLFYFESAELKVLEAALSDEQSTAVFRGNAHRLLSPARG